MVPFEMESYGNGFLFAFHSNYGDIFSRFDTIHERDRHPDRHRTTAEAALCSLTSLQSRGKKLRNVTKLHIRGETAISTWVNKARGYVAYVLYFVKDTYVRANVFHLNVRKQEYNTLQLH